MPQGKGTYGKVKGRPPKKGVKKIGKKKPMRRGQSLTSLCKLVHFYFVR